MILANLVFGVLLGGLPSIKFPVMGLAVAIFALAAVASMAEKSEHKSSIWLGSALGLLLAIAVVEGVARVFVIALEPGPYLVVRVGLESPGLLKFWIYFSQFGGRILAFGLVAFLVHKFLPVGVVVKQYLFLTMTLICLSIWSFISVLSLQIQVWPSFFSN